MGAAIALIALALYLTHAADGHSSDGDEATDIHPDEEKAGH
jgi:hypothetical protein